MIANIMIAEDHALFSDMLADEIKKMKGCAVTGTAATGKEVMKLITKGPIPELLILDIGMPDMNGIETIIWLQKHYPEIKILVLTMYEQEWVMVEMLQHGARGFLQKNISKKIFREAILAILGGEFYYPGMAAESSRAFIPAGTAI